MNGDTGLKQTTEQAWSNKYINIEELAAIVPIPENVLDDTPFDMWGAIRPNLEAAIARALDAAIFFGTNAPASWPDDIVTAATAAGHTDNTENNAAGGGFAQDVADVIALVEADGYDPTGIAANRIWRGRLRAVRDTTGQRVGDVAPNEAWGLPIVYPMRGLWPAATSGNVTMIVGDYDQVMLGIRQDFTYKVLTEAVIQDNTGAIVYNLAQQDMVALRVTFRVGWQIANLLTYDNPTEATRYPFALRLVP